jgi:hypothetical protein
MRKRYLVGFVLLLAVAALLPLVRDAFQRRADMIPWQRVQAFAARGDTHKAVVVVGDSLVESAPFAPTLCGLPVINAGLAGARANYALWVVNEMSRVHFSPSVLVRRNQRCHCCRSAPLRRDLSGGRPSGPGTD